MKLFQQFLSQLTTGFTPVIDSKFERQDYGLVDLSVNRSINLEHNPIQKTQTFINQFLKQTNKTIAFGGYLEQRNLYDRSPHFTNQLRDIHIGLDIWCPANTAVISPLNAVVHSFKDNCELGDYGPTTILQHDFEEITFYTLYGHLSRKSLDNIKVGQTITKASPFAEIGSAEVNGSYAPHLHFQIIRDLGDYFGDFPGVCSKAKLNHFSNNCPDPNLLLKIY
ncbi:peptidoglycan DD-metalloendopeptidase family protein [Psychroflexus sp. ALD_RP9]|uniref:peptidoglycan DD-metalloendopeptidase family protein n=1 Tax=Psychroflexus sp. ALD_RP9 TaxID=2777186 RepID=UPI001A8EF1AD|nr:peptidoglycan DD-metalloendopeptidase family protein [Psychroflexus sp. ALD_RP9]QSS96444.1 peptidoglycan DD-metalloendopeptidase family protein [Psychroflexus sp. ALD_RP9]